MRLLLDTHVALWAITDHPNLGQNGRQLVGSPDNEVWVSVASLWEIAIEHSLRRGDMPLSSRSAAAYFQEAGYRLLPIESEHIAQLESLPAHHNDPFDRLLVAQALSEPMRLLSHDSLVARYSSTIIRI